MLNRYTAQYTKIESGYMGKLVDFPGVITEAPTLEECREDLEDALREMIASYRDSRQELPSGGGVLEQITIEV